MAFTSVVWAFKDVIASSKLAAMVANIRDHDHRDDASQGAAILPVQLKQNSGFPVAITAQTAESVASRITIAAKPYAREVAAAASVFVSATVTADYGAVLYSDTNVIGRAQNRLTASVGESFTVVANGFTLPADTPAVLELRIIRVSGAGTFSTSVSSALTTLQALITRT